MPSVHLHPNRIDLNDRILVRTRFEFFYLSRRRDDLAANSCLSVVQPLADQRRGLIFLCLLEIIHQRRKDSLVWHVLAIPSPQRLHRLRQLPADVLGIVDRILQHGDDRANKRDQDKQEQRYNECQSPQLSRALCTLQLQLERHSVGGFDDIGSDYDYHGVRKRGGRAPSALPSSGYCASHALKRSRSCSPLSAQNCGSTTKTVDIFSGAVGRSFSTTGSMCGIASLLAGP